MSLKKIEDLNRILTELKIGSILIKRKRNGEKYSRRFYLDEHEDFISYYQSEKIFAQSRRYYIREIDEVRTGFHTLTFGELLKQQIVHSDDEKLAFSIFYNNYRDELHLMANDEQTRYKWVLGLQYLIDLYTTKGQGHIIHDTNWILSHLRFGDKDKSNTITKPECQQLLADSLNIELPEDVFEKLFQETDKNGEGILTPDEFINFFHVLARRIDLYEIMQKYVKNANEQTIETICMNINELLYFLRTVQNQNIITYTSKQFNEDFTVQPITMYKQVQELINKFEPNIELQEKGLLSLDGFRNLLLFEDFSLMKPWCSRRPYHDMTRPLNDYYINASHNTYLFDSQVSGDSNPEAYNRALRSGCRVVEMDCYDGDDGQPIVTHKFTFVKPCSFESIIRYIEPNLFKASPYPVILSIENHCSIIQQKEIARILKQILGDQLITAPITTKNSSVLPSPEDLKHKVLIRSVKIPSMTTTSKLLQDEDIDENNIFLNQLNKIVKHDLSDLFVFFESMAFRESDSIKNLYLGSHSPSLSERELKQVCRSNPIGLIKQTRKCLLRMYPDGLRQDSSNPNPIDAWNIGIQIVALNYQSDDHMMELCYGKFIDNGGCGYVLKPYYLIDIEKSKFNPFDYLKESSIILSKDINERPQRLILTIISGQFICRSNEKLDDISDPYVIISTHGILCDQQIKKTKFIENNGFNPIWNETFQFDIYFPQMCLVRFDVYDYDIFSHDDQLAYFCLPMTTMQTGYRHIHLKATDHDSTYSTLFVHVAIENK
ncbi:unnamed protein product [Rotaria sordida]|uniref:Phosphoinositide phospholipase C n=1 Tax=Rotaria sordida TaxID=392033 RepID=A0A818YNB5_9BILA|nr:unnamed protein product [Rotaria sordida]CAF3757082.1 unnamed protein product [Rotaria sordida]